MDGNKLINNGSFKISQDSIKKLQSIQDFPDLVKYLSDELDWPIETDDFEEMTFEYSAEELGLDKRISPKFLDIRRLRPLDNNQPWGIFFIAFDETKLPVVALRRLLSKLALTKRSKSNTGEHASWNANDLLLISQTGSNDGKSISFAHFASNPNKKDLPILKVLGWDSDDTGLKIDHVTRMLREKLIWPDNPADSQAWKEQWRDAFILKNREVIQSSKAMAEKLGQLALAVRTRLREVLVIESEEGPMHKLMLVFKENLISDLNTESFSDMYAQTIAYGLLSARIINPKANTADAAHTQIPITNPFLKELMETFLNIGGRKNDSSLSLDFDELQINEVVDLLDNTNMEAVLRDFGDRNQKEDPVMHFFEGFLEEYDSKIRKDRGVFYTPQPVVSFIVRSVDEQLRTEFGLEDGLADTTTWGEMAARSPDLEIPAGTSSDQAFVQILDPATGTGTFLVEVIDLIYRTMTAKWKLQGNREAEIKKLWNDYVPMHLLPRLHGYELMMAPYAIAHMKVGLKLYETGYCFESHERARIYLTNALEQAQDFSETFAFAVPSLANEAKAASAVKLNQRFTVVIGNPPYSGVSSNMGPWINDLLKGSLPDGVNTASYYHVDKEPLGERKIWLQDDYVKFIRLSQHCLELSKVGILGFITNHGYLDNPTFRGMRWSLMEAFTNISVLDLHGNSKKKESSPGGEKDVNVFNIQQGVSIGFFIRHNKQFLGIDSTVVRHADLWGERIYKQEWLASHSSGSMDWKKVERAPPFYLFSPLDQSKAAEYNIWPAIDTVMPVNVSGVVTARDSFVTDFDRVSLHQRISDLRGTSLSDVAVREKYFHSKVSSKYPAGDSRSWKLPIARQRIRGDDLWEKRYTKILYRPFDLREIYYTDWMVDWPRKKVMPHMLVGENLAIITARSNKFANPDHFFASETIVETKCGEASTQSTTFPIYLYPNVETTTASMFQNWPQGKEGRYPNLDFRFVQVVEQNTSLRFVSDGCGDLAKSFGPEDVISYIYGIFFSPNYRRIFANMLKLDYPRIPLPASSRVFVEVVQLGRKLLDIHLLKVPSVTRATVTFIGSNKSIIESVSYSEGTVWIDKAKTCGFKVVPLEVWNFQIGGYQVCAKWLKDRQAKGGKNPSPGRVLTDEDIDHYQKIVVALSETIRIMAEIDVVIEAHGGWPDAFSKN